MDPSVCGRADHDVASTAPEDLDLTNSIRVVSFVQLLSHT